MAKKPSLDEIYKLFSEIIIPFKNIERDMVIPGPKRHLENDAEHSWSLAVVACSLVPYVDPKLNIGLVAQFALVHDLTEIYAGDVSIWDQTGALDKKAEKEALALRELEKNFPQFSWMTQTLAAYESKASQEAKYVWAVDKMVPTMIRWVDKGRAYHDMKITQEHYFEGIKATQKKAKSNPVIGEYFDQIQKVFKEHPEFFYSKEKP